MDNRLSKYDVMILLKAVQYIFDDRQVHSRAGLLEKIETAYRDQAPTKGWEHQLDNLQGKLSNLLKRLA